MKGKKFSTLFVLAAVMLAGAVSLGSLNSVGGNQVFRTHKMTITSGDAMTAVALPVELVGTYLYHVEIYNSADDTVTFTINSGLGTSMASMTTTAATSGEYGTPTAFYCITSVPNYTMANLGSGTSVVEITTITK